jgi:hypothetical protein
MKHAYVTALAGVRDLPAQKWPKRERVERVPTPGRGQVRNELRRPSEWLARQQMHSKT